MELSKSQVDHLYQFVSSKYVRYLDVQHEIVDHLACAIEERMSQDEALTFKQALSNVYAEFPVTGFYNWVQAKEKAMRKYYRGQLWQALKASILDGRILLLLPVMAFCYYVLSTFTYGYWILLAIGLLLSTVRPVSSFKLSKDGQKLLATSVLLQYYSCIGTPLIIYSPQLIMQSNIETIQQSLVAVSLLSVFFSIFLISFYIDRYYFYPMIKEKLDQYGIATT